MQREPNEHWRRKHLYGLHRNPLDHQTTGHGIAVVQYAGYTFSSSAVGFALEEHQDYT